MADYTVQAGDNLWRITKNYYKDAISDSEVQQKVNELSIFNNIEDPSTINVGQNIDMSCFENSSSKNTQVDENIPPEEETAVIIEKKSLPNLKQVDNTPNEQIDFRSGGIEDYEFANEDVKNKAQQLWERSQNSAIQQDLQRNVPTLDENGTVVANSEFYKSDREGALSGYTIMVNSGHGGYDAQGEVFDPGAVNESHGAEEWAINQEYAEDLTQKLLDEGADVVFTQGHYKTVADEINNFANEFGSENNDNLKMVSLHSNSGFENASGIVFFNSDGENKLINSLNKSAQEKSLDVNGIQQNNTKICQTANSLDIDNALVEIGFMSNPTELDKMLNDDEFKDTFSDAMVEGLINDVQKTNK